MDLNNKQVKKILNMIAKAEGTTKRPGQNPYDAIVGYGTLLKPGQPDPVRGTPTANKPVSQMTFKEVKEFGRALVNASKGKVKQGPTKGSSAVGKYQLLANYHNTKYPIVQNLQKRLGYKDTDIFNAEAQDKLAFSLLMEVGKNELKKFIEKPSKDSYVSLMDKIGSRWAGVPTTENPVKREMSLYANKDPMRIAFNLITLEEEGDDPLSIAMGDRLKMSSRNKDDTERMLADEEKKSNPRMDALADRMRSLFKEKEVQETLKDLQSTKGLLKALGPSDGSTTSQIEKLAKSKNFIRDVDKLSDRSVIKMFSQLGDIIKNFLSPKEDEKQSSNFNLISKALASDKFNIDQLKTTNEKFQDLISRMAPAIDTSDIGVKRRSKPDTILSEEAGSPDMIGDTSDVDAPLKEYTGDKVGTAPELQPTDMDNLEATQKLFESDKPNISIDNQSGDSRTARPDRITGEPQERRSMATLRPTDDLPEFPEEPLSFSPAVSDDNTPNYAIVESTPILDPDDEEENNLTRARFAREEMNVGFDDPTDVGGEADPRDERDDPTDLSFFQRLFSGGFDFDMGRDSESELNIGADYFYDEPTDVGGEADPRDESDDVIMNFNEGGEVKADFDGKDDEDEDEGDPPPLAKPEEVADDIPALLSEGEYVLPANVVRYIGLERIMDMHRQVLAEIQQMEDLGMIQNVDKNGKPEDDDDEMKFAEGEEPEEGVTKGTIIIASAKPKGMMCPEPLRFNGGGTGTNDNDNDTGAGTEDPGKDFGGFDPGPDTSPDGGNVDPFGGVTGLGPRGVDKAPSKGVDYSGGFPSIEEEEKAKNENLGFKDRGGISQLDIDFYTSPNRGTGGIQDIAEQGLYGLGKGFQDLFGVEIGSGPEAGAPDPSGPGDSDFEFKDPEKVTEDEIKVDKVIEDLRTKNVYIEGVGYIPLASLMSPRDDIVV